MCPRTPTHPPRRIRGFTLLEVIIIIVVGGLLAALVVNLMGTQLLRSSRPAAMASDAAEAEAVMEAVVADYTTRMNDGGTYADLGQIVTAYTGNATVSINDRTASLWNTVPALIVTTSVGGNSYTTVLTQTRTSAADNATDF